MRKKKYKKEKSVLFSTDGKGNWWRREWVEQCDQDVFFYGRCQGVKGHKGVHWCYQPCGSLAWDDNENDPTEKGAAGSIPPGHKSYTTPEKMVKKYWLEHYTDTKVTDPKEIARLEADKMKPGESITRPVNLEEYNVAGRKKRSSKKST